MCNKKDVIVAVQYVHKSAKFFFTTYVTIGASYIGSKLNMQYTYIL